MVRLLKQVAVNTEGGVARADGQVRVDLTINHQGARDQRDRTTNLVACQRL